MQRQSVCLCCFDTILPDELKKLLKLEDVFSSNQVSLICSICGNSTSSSFLQLFAETCARQINEQYGSYFPTFSISLSLPLCFPARIIQFMRQHLKTHHEDVDKLWSISSAISQTFKQRLRSLLACALKSFTADLMSQDQNKKLFASVPASVVDFSLAASGEVGGFVEPKLFECIVAFHHSPLFIAGRYLKLKRNIAQSPWLDHSLPSVTGYIEPIVAKLFKCDASKFCSAGREDIDVKMLGEGRPFLIEVVNPRKCIPTTNNQESYIDKVQQALEDLRTQVLEASSGSVTVGEKLYLVKGTLASKLIKQGECDRSKTYRAVVASKHQLLEKKTFEGLEVNQKTPIRVLHRRSNIDRIRKVYECSVSPLTADKLFLEMTIKTQAGMYIKEFVHGDFGRTVPSLGELLFKDPFSCELLELDVIAVDMANWPPLEDVIA